jgi:MoaA/NifB/PqqE/SkfB family radical SAM enzyme
LAVKKKTVAFSKNAVNVFFHLLTQCNLNCRHCYINPDQHGTRPLDISTIRTWLDAFIPDERPVNVIFLGGEPTLHPDLALAIHHAKHLGYASITIDTNGYLFNDILLNVTPDEVDYISFSLDGPTAEVNDPIRGKGSFDTCTAGIRKAVSRGFEVSLIYTVSTANINNLPAMAALLSDLGVTRFFIQVLGIRGPSVQGEKDMTQVSRTNWQTIVPTVAEKVAANGIPVTYPKVFLNPGESFECAGNVSDNYFIFPNGRVYRCPLCEDYPIHALAFESDRLIQQPSINEADLFRLVIPEGCVINKLVQPGNLAYEKDGRPSYQIACCLLKEEIQRGKP